MGSRAYNPNQLLQLEGPSASDTESDADSGSSSTGAGNGAAQAQALSPVDTTPPRPHSITESVPESTHTGREPAVSTDVPLVLYVALTFLRTRKENSTFGDIGSRKGGRLDLSTQPECYRFYTESGAGKWHGEDAFRRLAHLVQDEGAKMLEAQGRPEYRLALGRVAGCLFVRKRKNCKFEKATMGKLQAVENATHFGKAVLSTSVSLMPDMPDSADRELVTTYLMSSDKLDSLQKGTRLLEVLAVFEPPAKAEAQGRGGQKRKADDAVREPEPVVARLTLVINGRPLYSKKGTPHGTPLQDRSWDHKEDLKPRDAADMGRTAQELID